MSREHASMGLLDMPVLTEAATAGRRNFAPSFADQGPKNRGLVIGPFCSKQAQRLAAEPQVPTAAAAQLEGPSPRWSYHLMSRLGLGQAPPRQCSLARVAIVSQGEQSETQPSRLPVCDGRGMSPSVAVTVPRYGASLGPTPRNHNKNNTAT